ncbi:RNA-directed DNA polymerase from mobile element jockey-like [Brachionus plicatilis]|uniref:RNA-directed DNA polymerase from mobile element jockey-like n=1 Tax=Brachionus plicatilis TaxID=10195 RepID=A0A3M7PYL8_BRAPC|nr:RNA-directed DNA polymerase from mobile element jockey-like [Brachionus plicatilis]
MCPRNVQHLKNGFQVVDIPIEDKNQLMEWITKSLTNRSFRVSYNGHTSKNKSIKCGVPKGSCLSPIIFILFFNDIAKSIPPDSLVHR